MSQVKAPVRCAVIGLGMGRGHARRFLEYPESELVAVADLNPERLAAFEADLGKDGLFTDYRAMLKQVQPDLVMVALPNHLHKPVSIEAMEAGSHVLCEKPMAMTVAEAEAMLAVSRACGRRLGINFSQRFTPMHRTLKQITDSGSLGTMYHGYCSWTRRLGFPGFGGWFGQKALSGGGPLIDLGVHRIDLALWLMGRPKVLSVSGTAHHHLGVPRAKAQGKAFDVEDFATGFIRLENGASLVFEISWAGHQSETETGRLRIMGTEGSIEMTPDPWMYAHRDGAFCVTKLVPDGAVVLNSCEEMVHCLVTGKPFCASAEQGIEIQKILNGLYESAETGREVTF